MSDAGKTLSDLDVKVGDVVGVDRTGFKYTLAKDDDGKWCDSDEMEELAANSNIWHLVSRATPQPDYNDGKWNGWNGGECPVHPESVVNVVYVDNDLSAPDTEDGKANRFFWYHNGTADIVSFRVIKEYKEPREFWVNPYTMEAAKEAVDHYIHVREVMK